MFVCPGFLGEDNLLQVWDKGKTPRLHFNLIIHFNVNVNSKLWN